jgi:protein-L-isoaspartate(D-aspartate) O-methyltransferase
MDVIDFARLRADMVDRQVAGRGVRNRKVLDAMRAVPREEFVPEALREFAYEDAPLLVAKGQAMAQPSVAAVMIEALQIERGEKVLEIGTGCGYTTALVARLAGMVYTVEPDDHLAVTAAATLTLHGCHNVHVLHSDAAQGWPEHAPFDAILVNGAVTQVPQALKQQLRVGGRLVMPMGHAPEVLELVRVTRLSEHEFRVEDIADVRFAPLQGPAAEAEVHAGMRWSRAGAPSAEPDEALARGIASACEKFATPSSANLEALLQRIGDARVVLLGEATHGSSEFYRMRERISRDLIERMGFSFVAIEGDWPDAARIDHHVRHAPAPAPDWTAFARFPAWMWRNHEMRAFVDWLRNHNARARRKVAFHGLDLYSLHTSIRAVLAYLEDIDPACARVARQRYACLTPWQSDPATYGRAVLSDRYRACEQEVVATLTKLLEKRSHYVAKDGERFLDAMQNARLVANAERYYRTMYYGSRAAWNLRDGHMFETLRQLLDFHGPGSKGIVWAHNAHIGDSAATEMALRGEHNLGHLCRREFRQAACLIGFGTNSGTVAAADDWDAPVQLQHVREAITGSYERLCHQTGVARFVLPLRGPAPAALVEALSTPRLERAIGVIYRPETERQSHYFEAVLPQQFDEYIWFDQTTAVKPLSTEEIEGFPDTYPFGL